MARMIPPAVSPETPSSERRIFEALRLCKGSENWTVLHSLGLPSSAIPRFTRSNVARARPSPNTGRAPYVPTGDKIDAAVLSTRTVGLGITGSFSLSPTMKRRLRFWGVPKSAASRGSILSL
jgi:hypothetical protein